VHCKKNSSLEKNAQAYNNAGVVVVNSKVSCSFQTDFKPFKNQNSIELFFKIILGTRVSKSLFNSFFASAQSGRRPS
jgi:hypothetical protein